MTDDTTTPPTPDSLGFWGVLEIMGHKRYAGFVTEVVLAGRGFVRIDVPDVPSSGARPAIAGYSKIFGTQAVYGITPTDEATARAMAAAVREQPVDQMLMTIAGLASSAPRRLGAGTDLVGILGEPDDPHDPPPDPPGDDGFDQRQW